MFFKFTPAGAWVYDRHHFIMFFPAFDSLNRMEISVPR
jgi:hypothetical protein